MSIDPNIALSQLVGSVPTFIAVILAWLNSNSRTSDLKISLDNRIIDTRDLLRAKFKRVEEVMDARIKHLEERER